MTQLTLTLSDVKRAWITSAKPVVLTYAATHGSFTSDDVRPLLPEPDEVNWIGCLFAQLRNTGFLHRLRYQTSTRREANGRPIAVWSAIPPTKDNI